MDKMKMPLSEGERITLAYTKMVKRDSLKQNGAIVLLCGIVVAILIVAIWGFGWIRFEKKQFNVEITEVNSLKEKNTFVIWTKAWADIDLPNYKPAYVRAKIELLQGGEVQKVLDTVNVLVIDQGIKEGRSGGYEYHSEIDDAEYQITPIFVYVDSDGKEKEISGQSVTHIW